MPLDRRTLLIGSTAAVVAAGLAAWQFLPSGAPAPSPAPPSPAPAPASTTAAPAQPAPPSPPALPADDLRLSERAVGRANAPVRVIEYFSLTCSHCADFHRNTYPRVKAELLETGRARLIFRDFPLDQIALRVHAIARSFPAQGYEPFISALFASQDRWAHARGVDHKAEIGRLAALAGMPPAVFDAAWADDALARAILESSQRGEREHNVRSTPTFVFGSRVVGGNLGFDRFAQEVAQG